jgi:hypothetical protein
VVSFRIGECGRHRWMVLVSGCAGLGLCRSWVCLKGGVSMDHKAGPPGAVRFGLLGPLLVADAAGRAAVIPAAKQRVVLAA